VGPARQASERQSERETASAHPPSLRVWVVEQRTPRRWLCSALKLRAPFLTSSLWSLVVTVVVSLATSAYPPNR
jgi:hypothetical protein